jgi:hypothetical protein
VNLQRRRPPVFIGSLLLVACLVGCRGLQLRDAGQADSGTLRLEVINDSEVPQVVALFAGQLRSALLRGGQYRPVSAQAVAADWDLQITLTDGGMQRLSHRPDDTGRALTHQWTLRARIEWVHAATGRVRHFEVVEQISVLAEPALALQRDAQVSALSDRLVAGIVARMEAWPHD